jgi:hypothetical protein
MAQSEAKKKEREILGSVLFLLYFSPVLQAKYSEKSIHIACFGNV